MRGAENFTDGSGAEKVRLSFSMLGESQIDDGIERLASLIALACVQHLCDYPRPSERHAPQVAEHWRVTWTRCRP